MSNQQKIVHNLMSFTSNGGCRGTDQEGSWVIFMDISLESIIFYPLTWSFGVYFFFLNARLFVDTVPCFYDF
jgi:hypothetical protein